MKKSFYFIVFLSLSLSLQAQNENITKMLDQAQMAVTMGYLDDAIDLYGKILQNNPQYAECYLELGNIYVKKGQDDVNAVQNAILNFQKYLELKPKAQNASDVQSSINKLEYVLKKAVQKQDNREFLQGRWASADARNNPNNNSLFILDFKEIGDKLQITVDPTSLAYSKDFFNKTAYIDKPDADEYVVSFTDDKNYVPSGAKYNFNSDMINIGANQLGNVIGGVGGQVGGQIVGGVLNYFNNRKQEKDVQKKTLTGFDLRIKSTPDENNELECIMHVYVKEQTPYKEQIVIDSMFINGFNKVESNYTNILPSRVSRDAGVVLKNYPNEEISKLFKKGTSQKIIGTILLPLGGVIAFTGVVMLANEDTSTGVSLLVSGLFVDAIGIPLLVTGVHNRHKAVRLYQEDIRKKSNTSELKIGLTDNGVGLTFNF